MSDRDSSGPGGFYHADVDAESKDAGYEAAVQGYASRNPRLHEIVGLPGDYIEVFMCRGSVFGRHAYRVESDGKLRRANGFRSKIAHGEGESKRLPPLYREVPAESE